MASIFYPSTKTTIKNKAKAYIYKDFIFQMWIIQNVQVTICLYYLTKVWISINDSPRPNSSWEKNGVLKNFRTSNWVVQIKKSSSGHIWQSKDYICKNENNWLVNVTIVHARMIVGVNKGSN